MTHPMCSHGRKVAARQAEKGEVYADYGQHDHGYDPEGLADPDAHNYQPDHVSRIQPRIRHRNWDLDSDEDFID